MKHRHKQTLTTPDGEVHALTTTELARFQPATEVLPIPLQEKLGIRRRGPQKAPIKTRITIRLSQEVVTRFRASGTGWQGRMDNALKDWLRAHSL